MEKWRAGCSLPCAARTENDDSPYNASSTGGMRVSHSKAENTLVRYTVSHTKEAGSLAAAPLPSASANAAAPPITKVLSIVWSSRSAATAASSEGATSTSSGIPSALQGRGG